MENVNVNENVTRMVSSNVIEKVRESMNMDVKSFIEGLLAYEVKYPSESLKDAINGYVGKLKGVTKVAINSKNNVFDIVKEIIESNIISITGEVEKVQSSRKHVNPNIYMVRIRQKSGKAESVYFDFSHEGLLETSVGALIIDRNINISNLKNKYEIIVEKTDNEKKSEEVIDNNDEMEFQSKSESESDVYMPHLDVDNSEEIFDTTINEENKSESEVNFEFEEEEL